MSDIYNGYSAHMIRQTDYSHNRVTVRSHSKQSIVEILGNLSRHITKSLPIVAIIFCWILSSSPNDLSATNVPKPKEYLRL